MILALDLGSTNFKAALFSGALERLGGHAVATPYSHHDGSRVEMDAGCVRQAAADLIQETCRRAGFEWEAVSRVAITSQAQNFVVLDAAGQARTPVTSWLDGRADAEARELWEALGGDWHQHCSFGALNGCMQLAHLLRVLRETPDVLRDGAQVVSLPGLVFHMLSGLNLTDENLAAMGGCFSLREGRWRRDALSYCGVAEASLPRVVAVGERVAVPRGCGMGPGNGRLTLVSAGNDQTAGAYANGCADGDVVVTLGTALVAYRYAGLQPGPYSAEGCWGPYPGGGCYELAAISEGCLALDWARETLMPGASVETFDAVAATGMASLNETGGFFHPTRMQTADAWQGRFADVNARAYAVLEGIAFALRRLLREDLGCPESIRLQAIGGGSHSALWLQLIAEALGCRVAAGGGDSLLGAAAMAVGRRPACAERAVYEPGPERVRDLNARYEKWR